MATVVQFGRWKLWRFDRLEFIASQWRYAPGQHVTLIGRNGAGKTWLMFELLVVSTSPDLPGLLLVMKPVDDTVSDWLPQLGWKRVRAWPPPTAQLPPWAPNRPSGWALWPKLGDINTDTGTLAREFHQAMAQSYAQAARRNRQPRVLVADEVVGIAQELGLQDDLDALWMRGRSMGLGLWAGGQRPFNMPLHAYEQAVHLFLWRATDRRNRRRYAEIGGVDPDMVDAVVSQLQGRDALYIRRTDYSVCVVGGNLPVNYALAA